MSFLSRLRALLSRPKTATRVGVRRPTSTDRADAPREDALRAVLVEDPNNREAFAALAEVVRRHASGVSPADPLTAEQLPPDARRASDVAVWALAEELAGNPRAWYPLVELARLSLSDDHEGAMRRLHGACEREHTGLALAEGVRVLREADLPGEGAGLGVSHWAPRDHVPEAGRQVVLAALEGDRPLEARRHLNELAEARENDPAVTPVLTELEARVAAAVADYES
ncbi:hypothetical protein PU560_16935 [Georgenia sp. 10Sc9-8]|uniref:HEAT repeat domain-containing protein n=1 Tax=Georgenia halotolerans TaxID=3028317 RepID=A0ABT5U1U5_9MICO|nr:hypothetical protein [Georgenia halotolerans]